MDNKDINKRNDSFEKKKDTTLIDKYESGTKIKICRHFKKVTKVCFVYLFA